MNIRDLHISGNRPDHIRPGSTADTGRIDGGTTTSNGTTPVQPENGDRVEISSEARAAAGSVASNDVTFAKKALLGIPPLSEDRAADILKRVQEGFYSQPETLKQIASNIAADLTGSAAES